MTHENSIRDNYQSNTAGSFLKNSIENDAIISVVSAYFTLQAFYELKDSLYTTKSFRFLFGEPSFIKQTDDNKKPYKSFSIATDEITLDKSLKQRKIAKDCAKWVRQDNVEIKSIDGGRLIHGKMYHIENTSNTKAILGSSNFTGSGLGFVPNNNLELNIVISDDRDRKSIINWFNNIWNAKTDIQTKDVKKKILESLKELYRNNPPDLIYHKTLYHLFEEAIKDMKSEEEELEKIHFKETVIWNKLFDFQKDAVKEVIARLNKYGGCILADSVGLGKTFEAIAVIKYFQTKYNNKILVLCPKKLEENWLQYIGNKLGNILIKDNLKYEVFFHTDLGREGKSNGNDLSKVDWANYDLVVIDESHNFRNRGNNKFDLDTGDITKKSRYNYLLENIIASEAKTKVLLLSATPVNTSLKDIKNQINLIEGYDKGFIKNKLEIGDLSKQIDIAEKKFQEWAKKKNRNKADLINNLPASFFTMMDELTISRSRSMIRKYYAHEIDNLGGFPQRMKPYNIMSDRIDTDNKFPSYEKIFSIMEEYKLSIFNPFAYIHESKAGKYEHSKLGKGLSQKYLGNFLIGMMRCNLFKRLESSIHAFKLTIGRTIEKIEKEIKNLESAINHIDKKKLLSFDFAKDEQEELFDAIEVGGKLNIHPDDLNINKYIEDLKNDRELFKQMYEHANEVSADRDYKLQTLKQELKKYFSTPQINKQNEDVRKVLIFTASVDTAEYIYYNLKDWIKEEFNINTGLVTGSNTKSDKRLDFSSMLSHFAPRAKDMTNIAKSDEIDLLIASDAISEGQNLQDCNTVINYDIHWNPVLLIQRFGRIDRIGSLNKQVQMINFWASADLNSYIRLRERVESRMEILNISATGDDNLLKQEETELSYRDKQLMRIKDEVGDLEDFDQSVSMSDLNLQNLRDDLKEYMEQIKKDLEDTPLGLYAVVPSEEKAEEGFVFCLRKKVSEEQIKEDRKLNSIAPYFLVYVKNSGEIKYTFAHSKLNHLMNYVEYLMKKQKTGRI